MSPSQASSSSHSKTLSQAIIPMWDSSDPARNPPPLPLRPHNPGSPIAAGPGLAGSSALELTYESPNSSREVSPERRPRADSFGNGSPVQGSPKRASMPAPGAHKRTGSTAPSPSVREMHNLILNGAKPETSPARGGTPTPRELFGSSTSFPSKDRDILQPREYSSQSFRKSLEFDKGPAFTPLRTLTGPGAADTPPPPPHTSLIRSPAEYDDTPAKVTVHDIHTLSSQLTGITTIATNLQREMTNLSRRSKDNATDLMALKEAARNRDEDIRRSLRDLQNGLTSFDAADRLLEGRHSHLATSVSSGSDRGSNYGDDMLVNPKLVSASTQALEKALRDMPTKDEQDRALRILQDIQASLKAHQSQGTKGEAEEKILSVLEEIRDREDSRGKEVALIGPRAPNEGDPVLSMLEDLREDLRQEKDSEEKIMSILEEIREKETQDRADERILSAIDELKGKEGDERLDRVVALLEELRDRDPDERVLSMLEDVRAKLEVMSEDLAKQPETETLDPTAPPGTAPALLPAPANDEILAILKTVEEGVSTGGGLSQDIKRLVEDWREIWTGHDKTIGDALKDLGGQIEVLASVQRAAMAKMPSYSNLGLPSQALTTTNPPLPPDLDNEAAITALANIASTTTRTDITLSSINALIKVFQKESYHSNTSSTEALATLGRFLEDIGQAIGTTNSQAGDIRKVLEVVRTGVCSGNDRLAEFESNSARQIDELTHLQKNLQRNIMGDDEEALWKVDLGVKDDVEELSKRIDELCDKNVEALKSSTATTIEAIDNINPAQLIEELKSALGAMAQRSLDAFKNSEEAIQRLKEETATNAERNIEAIRNANQDIAISDFRTEVKQMAEKSYAICQAIDAKCGSAEVENMLSGMKRELSDLISNAASTATNESTDLKSAIDKLRDELDAKMEDSLTTAVALASADEKTSAALAELKTEVSDTLAKAVVLAEKDDSERVLGPIRELRQEVIDMIEKSNTALAAPVHYPEAEAIKSRIELLARELFEAMEKTADLVAETGLSNGDAGQQVKSTVEALRKDIGAMGSSIAAAVASNSATAVEEGIRGAFEDMKETVLVKVEQGLVVSDKAVSCIADLSQQTRDSINDLKKEVMEMMNKSISMAVATVKPDDSEAKNKSLLDALETKITDVVISSMAASTNSDDLKELIESLKADIDGMGKQIAVPAAGSDDVIKKALAELKESVAGIISIASSSQETQRSIERLRAEVQEMMEKTVSMVTPTAAAAAAASSTTPYGTAEKIEETIAGLKEEVNEMVEKSLAAAIANSTFDSEENVKEAIEELKRDVKDTLEKSMVPLPQQANNESSRMVREAMEVLRQELAAMLDKRAIGEAEDRDEVVTRLDALKGQFAELLEKSTSVEIKEAVDVLKIQVHGLLEKSSGAEYADLKEMIRALNGQVVVRTPMPADDEVNVILEALRSQVEELAGKISDGDIKSTLDELKAQVEGILTKPAATADTSELKDALESIRSQIEGLISKPDTGASDLREAIGELKTVAGSLKDKPSADELKTAIDSLKPELEATVDKSTSKLSTADDVFAVKLLIEAFKEEFSTTMKKHSETTDKPSPAGTVEAIKNDLKAFLEKSINPPAPIGSQTTGTDTQVKEFRVAVEELRKDVKQLIAKSGTAVVSAPSEKPSGLTPTDSVDVKETVADISSAVGECRVEVAIVKALLEEKSSETSDTMSALAKIAGESHSEVSQSMSTLNDAVSSVKATVDEFRTESKDGMVGVKEVVEGLQKVATESTSRTVNTIAEFRTDARDRITEVKAVVDSIKDDTRESFEEVNKTVEGAQVELKEAVASLDKKLEGVQSDIKEAIGSVEAAVGGSNADTEQGFTSLATTIEATHSENKGEIAAVRKLIDDARSANSSEHEKTHQQVTEVLGLVDGLQTEWKGHQPTLSDALSEMKKLLLEAQEMHKAAAAKPDIELPPPYDDSQAQTKLDQLLAGNEIQAKYLPQLELLSTIQQQVSATSASISMFIDEQKSQALDEAAVKVEAARQAEIDLEKSINDKRLIEAATERLRDEHDKLQVSVEILQEETEDLRERKLTIAAELTGIETALMLRREELLMLEARSEALERRMLDGILEQSRQLLRPNAKLSKSERKAALRKVKDQPSPLRPKVNVAGAPTGVERRHFSQSQMGTDGPSSKSGRTSISGGGSLGLGQKEYSASLGLLQRSQSVKHTSYSAGRRKASIGKTRLPGSEAQRVVDEEAEYEEYAHESEEEEGSVIRCQAEDGDDGRSKYIALGLDFSGTSVAGSRSVSGVSSMA